MSKFYIPSAHTTPFPKPKRNKTTQKYSRFKSSSQGRKAEITPYGKVERLRRDGKIQAEWKKQVD